MRLIEPHKFFILPYKMENKCLTCNRCGERLVFDQPIRPSDTVYLSNVGYWCYTDFILRTFPLETQKRMLEIQEKGEKIHFLFTNDEGWKEQVKEPKEKGWCGMQ